MNELLLKNASEKLRREMRSENPSEPATMIQKRVAEALDEFCKQEPKIAEAIIKSKDTFSECCEKILRDTKQERYISDFKAFQRAVEFYVPEARIEFNMTVRTNNSSNLNISLMSLI